MTKEDVFRNYIGAYYGVRLMDEYDLKAYTLKNIENFIKEHPDYEVMPEELDIWEPYFKPYYEAINSQLPLTLE